MSRDRYKTVTSKESFVLLIPASADAAVGEATFLSETSPDLPAFVRPVSANDIKSAARSLKGNEALQFDALLALKGGLETQDALVIAGAVERVERVYSAHQKTLVQYGWSREFIDAIRPGPKGLKHPARHFSFAISRIVGNLNTSLVLWWNAGRFYPAIFCIDKATALYVQTFFIAPTSGTGFRICPHCHNQFHQDRPNQDYCCPAHRDAHRVARFRNAKKIIASQPETNRRKNVTQKAR